VVAAKVRKGLYGGIKKARKQFREHGVPLADFLAARSSRPKLRQLVRKTEGHAQLLESSAHASGPTPKE
jgi:arsenate reductase-like glutaredoxin family protein